MILLEFFLPNVPVSQFYRNESNQDTRERNGETREIHILHTRFTSLLFYSQHLSINVAWNGDGIFMSDVSRTHTTSCVPPYLEPFVVPRVRPAYWPRRWDIRTGSYVCSD